MSRNHSHKHFSPIILGSGPASGTTNIAIPPTLPSFNVENFKPHLYIFILSSTTSILQIFKLYFDVRKYHLNVINLQD